MVIGREDRQHAYMKEKKKTKYNRFQNGVVVKIGAKGNSFFSNK